MKRQLLFSLLVAMFWCGQSRAQENNAGLWPKGQGQVISSTHLTFSYSEKHEQAEWVFYELTAEETLGRYERVDNFRADPRVNSGSAELQDYFGSGFDRGHLAPAADMAFSPLALTESFYLSNMSPQHPSFNRGVWRQLEALVRAWAQEDGDLYIITGPILEKSLATIGFNRVSVPRFFYKVILDKDEDGIRAIAFVLANEKGYRKLDDYALPIDSVESLTGMDFFHSFDDDLEAEFESKITGNWNYNIKPQSISSKRSKGSQATRCQGITQAGYRCKRTTNNASGFCWQHQGQTDTPMVKPHSTRCSASTKSGSRCKRMTKNTSGRCWQHE